MNNLVPFLGGQAPAPNITIPCEGDRAPGQLIYVVDDDATSRFFISEALERAGFKVLGFEDGDQVLRALEETAPDLIIADVFMPQCDGFELLTRVRNAYPKLAVLIMSGGSFMVPQLVLETGMLLGASASLTKPFDRALLLQRTRDCLNRLGGENG